jgi:nitrogen fixation NifU-like protein
VSDLDELYQEVILDHTRRPRNFGRLAAANRRASGDNPLCGDRLDLELEVRDGRIQDVAFQGAGCAISTASASLMTEAVKGRPLAEVQALAERFHTLMTGEGPAGEELGKLAALSGVRAYPMRVKCATLAWHTLRSALAGAGATVTTETE